MFTEPHSLSPYRHVYAQKLHVAHNELGSLQAHSLRAQPSPRGIYYCSILLVDTTILCQYYYILLYY